VELEFASGVLTVVPALATASLPLVLEIALEGTGEWFESPRVDEAF
jgi:hypothetical protein